MLWNYGVQLLLGIAVGFYSYLSPGIINIQVFQLSTRISFKQIILILFLISLVEIPYCIFCMLGFKWIMSLPYFQIILSWLIVMVLFIMAWFTYKASNRKNEPNNPGEKKENMSIQALLLFALLNPFQWSAWSIWGAYFIEKTWFQWNITGIVLFSVGAFLGAFLILLSYALVGKKWIHFFTENRNKVDRGVALLLFILGLIQLFRNLS